MGTDVGVFSALFASAFLAATVLPALSEIGLASLLAGGAYAPALLIAVASVGNTLGSVVNWVLGRSVERFSDRRWFPATPRQLDQATRWYSRYGRWSLLLSWVPVIGDPLTIIAGVLREPLWRFLVVVGLAKTFRYLIVAAIAYNVI